PLWVNRHEVVKSFRAVSGTSGFDFITRDSSNILARAGGVESPGGGGIMPHKMDLHYSVDVFDERGNQVAELDRFENLNDAREAYAAALRKPRRSGHIVTLRNKCMVLRSSDRQD